MKEHTYLCPVCGFNELLDPPEDYNICPSCGTEFGLHEWMHTYDELRARWLASGPRWHSLAWPRPENWNPYQQLMRITNPLSAPQGETIVVQLEWPRTRAKTSLRSASGTRQEWAVA